MKVAAVIITSLMGYALAAPVDVDSNAPATSVDSNASAPTNTPSAPTSTPPAPIKTPPAPNSPEKICLSASAKVFLKCIKAPKRDEPKLDLHERCYKERDDAKASCLGHDAESELDDVDRKTEDVCTAPINRVFAQCKKDRVLKGIQADCEKDRDNAREECVKNKGLKPDQQETTPGTEEATPDKEEATPDKEEATQSCPSKPKEEATPIKEEATPIKEEVTPIKEEVTPIKEEVAPIKEEAAPVKEEAAQSCPSKPKPESDS
ncbi:LMW6DL protein [Beauveria bassiana ARSEF 2860]|uniref:LMW6DL protein n=1 Tax=Beauveria bassiana (strain ARSEF 2860) TaxID=655819 RepID=J4W8T5_BEAB2|nr:LMW6DL protein [Beauveria bassiana ARSEF 2860]EJP66625.1 LMW6DL protein [Beauveria bassiana ARSEF 2860]